MLVGGGSLLRNLDVIGCDIGRARFGQNQIAGGSGFASEIPGRHTVDASAIQNRFVQISAYQIRPAQVGATQVAAAEYCAAEIGIAEVCVL